MRAIDAVGDERRLTRGRVVVGSLAWNDHVLCRDVVVSLLKVSGWDVVDLGGNASPARFADACAETSALVLVIAELPIASARMVSKVPRQEVAALVEEMEVRGIRQRTRILLVGFAADSYSQGLHEVDMICDDLAGGSFLRPEACHTYSCNIFFTLKGLYSCSGRMQNQRTN